MVKITFKTPSQSKPFTLDIDVQVVTTILNLKQRISEHTGDPVENIKLIHKGKILKDDASLSGMNLSEQETMHAVIKHPEQNKKTQETNQKKDTTNTNSNTNNTNNTSGLGGMGGMGGFGGMGGMGGFGGMGGMGGMGGLGGMDPVMMQQMMANITPEMMEQMINTNPMLKNMVDSNPGLKAMLSNPQMLQAMLNPSMIQAAMSQMGSGGYGGMGGMGGMGGLSGLGGFGGMGGSTGTTNTNQQQKDPKQLYKDQLQQLKNMGFTNESVNIDVLKATGGNVEAAVQRLLNMMN